jgi:asparagine synthase (glutamine-hydrolysing)
MCGITALFSNQENISKRRELFLEMSKKIRHRGPDWNGIYLNDNKGVFLGHERLSIVGIDNGSQPLIHDGIILSINGEIYNHNELYKYVLHNKYINQSGSDCEVILYLYKEFGVDCIKMLDGIFSFVIYDSNKNIILATRDPIGVTPLYYGHTSNGELAFASELKSLHDCCETINVFKPAHYLYVDRNQENKITDASFVKYYDPDLSLYNEPNNSNEEFMCDTIRRELTNAIEKRLMCDVPFGVLLSGGLDSSLIASITSRLLKYKPHSWGSKLHSFSIGLKGSPDLEKARIVSEYLGTIHHEYIFTFQEGLDAIKDLIYMLETYDVTTIRASAPMYLMSRKIKAMGIKMVLSGEGADEVFGGYLYFHQAPDDKQFHEECCNRVGNLSHFDCLRANKSTMAWGVEARVPFLDKSFLHHAMNIHPSLKLKDGKEKYILRKAFDTPETPYLPDEILWRQKEQFSDGVGYDWIDGLLHHVKNSITDQEMENLKDIYTQDIPVTKEALYYRRIFDSLFPERFSIIPRWVPRTDWNGVSYDPSGRAQLSHNHTNLA